MRLVEFTLVGRPLSEGKVLSVNPEHVIAVRTQEVSTGREKETRTVLVLSNLTFMTVAEDYSSAIDMLL